jgi:hypothetical protein
LDSNGARVYFKSAGLSYANLKKEDIISLQNILSEELSSYLTYGGDHAQQMNMRVSKHRIKDIKVFKTWFEICADSNRWKLF